jgi:hypothetical protein
MVKRGDWWPQQFNPSLALIFAGQLAVLLLLMGLWNWVWS